MMLLLLLLLPCLRTCSGSWLMGSRMRTGRDYDGRPRDADRMCEMLNLLLQRCNLLAQGILHGLNVHRHCWREDAYASKTLGSPVETLYA
jgi:hypothetical protein